MFIPVCVFNAGWVLRIRGCCWVVMVVALCVCGCGQGAGLAVPVLVVAQWWHLSACFFRMVSRLTSRFLALFGGGLKVPHWKGQTLTTVCLTACNSCSEGEQPTTQQAWPQERLLGSSLLHARVWRLKRGFFCWVFFWASVSVWGLAECVLIQCVLQKLCIKN